MDTLSSHDHENKPSYTPTSDQIYLERERVRRQIKRAVDADVPATLTVEEWLAILERYHWKCAYCKIEPFFVLEHRIPVIVGGGTTAENCLPACGFCNAKKGNKIIADGDIEQFAEAIIRERNAAPPRIKRNAFSDAGQGALLRYLLKGSMQHTPIQYANREERIRQQQEDETKWVEKECIQQKIFELTAITGEMNQEAIRWLVKKQVVAKRRKDGRYQYKFL